MVFSGKKFSARAFDRSSLVTLKRQIMKQNNLLKLIAIGAFCSVPFIMSGCAAVAVGAATGTTGAIIGSDSRTIDSMFYDETIEQNAYKIFKENEKLSKKDDFSVSVISMSGNVLLVGQTINSEYFNSCLEKIKRLDYVRKVYNFVTFKQPVSAGVTANDTYITSKIKTKLLFGENIRSGRFKVVTKDSMVYLLGYVTRDEAIRAVNEVQKIDGVKKIYTIFDYMENVPVQKPSSNPPVIDQSQASSGTYSDTQPISTVSSEPLEISSSGSYDSAVGAQDNGGAVIVDDTSLPGVY